MQIDAQCYLYVDVDVDVFLFEAEIAYMVQCRRCVPGVVIGLDPKLTVHTG